MSALKSITLPAKSLPTTTTMEKNILSNSSANLKQVTNLIPKLNFTTSILVKPNKIIMENPIQTKKFPPIKPMESQDRPVAADTNVVFKQNSVAPQGQKRKLNLTYEERQQRKKLKNRVAAQTSRDRKKAKFDELEEEVRILKEKNEKLVEECTMLRAQNECQITEIQKLKMDKELMESKKTKKLVCSMCQARVDCTVPALGSAVSPINPLQQGGTVKTARPVTLPSTTILLKILTLYLLSKIYLENSKEKNTWKDLKTSQKTFCKKLPLKWKQILLSLMNRNYLKKKTTKNLTLQKTWWGRNQIMWKLIHPAEA